MQPVSVRRLRPRRALFRILCSQPVSTQQRFLRRVFGAPHRRRWDRGRSAGVPESDGQGHRSTERHGVRQLTKF